jgi:hypothetical protein
VSGSTGKSSMTTLVADLNAAHLGPIAAADYVGSLIRVELDWASPRKAQTLQRWLTLISVRDMTAGKYLAKDDTVYLNIRGWFPSGTAVAVAAPYSEVGEPDQVRAIYDRIESQDVAELVAALVSMEL